jgi:hypothetical protein
MEIPAAGKAHKTLMMQKWVLSYHARYAVIIIENGFHKSI